MKYRALVVSSALVACLFGYTPANAVPVPMSGVATIDLGLLPPVPVPFLATGNLGGSLPSVTNVTLPAGAIVVAGTIPISPPLMLGPLAVTAAKVALSNQAFSANDPGTCTATHPGVGCLGAGLAGFGAVNGTVTLCALGCVLALPINVGSVIGGGSTTKVPVITGVTVTISGAGWTTGTGLAFNIPTPTNGTNIIPTLPIGAGSQTGTGAGTAAIGTISFVTPVKLSIPAVPAIIPASISMQLAPNPPATETPTATPTATPTVTPISGCPSTPDVGCLTAEKALLDVRAGNRDLVKFKWLKGPELSIADFGDPVSAADYTLCIYTDSDGSPSLAVSLDVPSGAGWRIQAGKGWLYKDREATNDGVVRIRLKAGDEGKTKAVLVARGDNVPMPGLPFELDVIAQLRNNDSSTCLEAEFALADLKKHQADRFRGVFKADG